MNASALRWGVRGAWTAAGAFVLSAILALIFPGPNMGPEGSLSWYLIETSDGIGVAGMLAAFIGLHVHQRPRDGRLGTAGFAVTVAGSVCALLAYALYVPRLTDGVALDVLEYGWFGGWLIGLPLLGTATMRAGVFLRWSGLVVASYPAVFALGLVLVDQFGEARALLGLPWVAVAYALRAATRPPSHPTPFGTASTAERR